MSPFDWKSDNSVFLAEVDNEHQELYRMAEELRKAVDAQASKDARAILKKFLRDITTHFAHEEELMREARYPSLDWHVRQHRAAVTRAGDCAERVRRGDLAGAAEFLDFMSEWLWSHTTVADKMMASYVRNRRRAAGVTA